MLTAGEKDFLSKIPRDRVIRVFPYNPRASRIAEKLIELVHRKYPDLSVLHLGASGLGISGQGDIDIYCLASFDNFSSYQDGLIELFGQPKSSRPESVAWVFQKGGFEVELYLTDPSSSPMQRQLAVYQKLKNNPELLKKYEHLKQVLDGKLFREYQKRKYRFYHEILGD